MELGKLVNDIIMTGALAVGIANLANKGEAATIHDQPGAALVFSDNFTNNHAYAVLDGWNITNNTLRSSAQNGLLAAYNAFTNQFENIELQLRIKLDVSPSSEYRFEVAMYQINVGSVYSAVMLREPNTVFVIQSDSTPAWMSTFVDIPFNHDAWHDLSFVKTGLHIETYLDGQLVGDAITKKDYPVNSFNITYSQDYYFNLHPEIEISRLQLWTKPSGPVPILDAAKTVTLTWSANTPNVSLLSSPKVNGVYSLENVNPVVEGTNNTATFHPTNDMRFFKLLNQE